VPLQGSEGEQSGGRIFDETKEHDAAMFGKNRTEKVPYKDEERGNVSDEIAVPLQDGESEKSGARHHGKKKTICFITCVFGTSVEKTDKPQNVRKIFKKEKRSDYDFRLFTNLENLPTPGWKKIVLKDLPYRRFITQSRWGKFVGWRHESLAHCGTVIYTNAYVSLNTQKRLKPFRKLAAK
jgi:hypothetical protein